jgi:branched-subunit amino acid aminotransferase/4-amino-4-deoxychorismate lyase
MDQRKYLEDERGECNEVVLIDKRGLALEGTQTNFFAIIDNCVRTASATEVGALACLLTTLR